jgi:hypothetical protein
MKEKFDLLAELMRQLNTRNAWRLIRANKVIKLANELLIKDENIDNEAAIYMRENTPLTLITELRQTKIYVSVKLSKVSVEFALVDA